MTCQKRTALRGRSRYSVRFNGMNSTTTPIRSLRKHDNSGTGGKPAHDVLIAVNMDKGRSIATFYVPQPQIIHGDQAGHGCVTPRNPSWLSIYPCAGAS